MNKYIRWILLVWIPILTLSEVLFNYGSINFHFILSILRSTCVCLLASYSVYTLYKNKTDAIFFLSTLSIFLFVLLNQFLKIYLGVAVVGDTFIISKIIVRSVWYILPIGYLLYKYRMWKVNLKHKDRRFQLVFYGFWILTVLSLIF